MSKHLVYLVVGAGAMVPIAVLIGILRAWPMAIPVLLMGAVCWLLGYLILEVWY